MTSKTEALSAEVLIELLKFLRRENEQRERECFEQELAETPTRRRGYPFPQQGRRS
jgi:hypothetical protein